VIVASGDAGGSDRAGPFAALTWRPVTEADFPLLADWLARPHVRRWWNHETDAGAIQRDFGPVARREEPAEDLLVFDRDEPIGLVQRSLLTDYPVYRAELAAIVPVPEQALTLDYLIADAGYTGRGLGAAMVSAVLRQSWTDHPQVAAVIIPVVAANVASWRMLERVGFIRVAEGQLEPDNPIDDPLHYVYRIDRPVQQPRAGAGLGFGGVSG
jgi:aminoglycoside 6'-N-acetyltransferase